MELVTNFAGIKCQNMCSPKKRANYDNLCFLKKQRKLYFHIINNHTQGHVIRPLTKKLPNQLVIAQERARCGCANKNDHCSIGLIG